MTIRSRQLIALTLPTALSAMLNNAYRVIDQQAVQWLGVEAQAAIASCTFILIGYYAVYAIISAGTLSLVARAVGGGHVAEQKRLIGNALTGALLIGMVVLALSGLFAPVITHLLGLSDTVAEQAAIFLRWQATYCLPQALMPTLDAIFIAYKRPRIVLFLQVIATVLNIVLNPICIYQLGYGIGGSAMATGLSQAVAALLGLICLRRATAFRFTDMGLGRTVLKIAKIGLPMCWGTLMFALVYAALLHWVISPLGAPVNAALGIGFSALEGFTWPIFWGFSMGIASIVGRNLGAGDVTEAKHAIRLAFKLLTVTGLLVSGVFFFGARFLCGLFTQDPQVLAEAICYAQILAFSQLFIAYESLAEGILSGAGKTHSIFYWSAPLNIMRVPFSWLFAVYWGYGAAAVWWVIGVSTALKALGKWWSVRSGAWQL
ncbi:MAG: MATE family efflux transporter [Methylovulum sp.]|nr:MATE family efflux transporter [Methylovulum sp.]